jgi:major membrane immunogen (membrane-anchored lipoprotein)
MSNEKFIELVKKELLHKATQGEKTALSLLVKEDESFAAVYKEIFTGRTVTIDEWETDAAYALQVARMKNRNLA